MLKNLILWTMIGFSKVSGMQMGRVEERSVETMEAGHSEDAPVKWVSSPVAPVILNQPLK